MFLAICLLKVAKELRNLSRFGDYLLRLMVLSSHLRMKHILRLHQVVIVLIDVVAVVEGLDHRIDNIALILLKDDAIFLGFLRRISQCTFSSSEYAP